VDAEGVLWDEVDGRDGRRRVDGGGWMTEGIF